jgi:DNA-binding GntR family transcriptional regulator
MPDERSGLVGELDVDYAPAYIRLARVIRDRIADGTYSVGYLLQARQLAEVHEVSVITARRALQVLARGNYAECLDAEYTPRYIWLARLIREWIEDGTYPAGGFLPSSKQLAEVHGVSVSTARLALRTLFRNSYVCPVPGLTWYVINQLSKAKETPAE